MPCYIITDDAQKDLCLQHRSFDEASTPEIISLVTPSLGNPAQIMGWFLMTINVSNKSFQNHTCKMPVGVPETDRLAENKRCELP